MLENSPLSLPPLPPYLGLLYQQQNTRVQTGGSRVLPRAVPVYQNQNNQEVRQYTTARAPSSDVVSKDTSVQTEQSPQAHYTQTPVPGSGMMATPPRPVGTQNVLSTQIQRNAFGVEQLVGGALTGSLPKMRTYRSDVNTVVNEKGISVADIALAENRRHFGRLRTPKIQARGSYAGTIILILLFFIIGGVAFYVGYQTLQLPENLVLPGSTRRVLIVTETDEEIEITARTPLDVREQLRSRLLRADIAITSIREYFFTTTRIASDGPEKLYVGAPLFFGAINSNIPAELVRNIADAFIYGVFSFDGNRGFLIFRPTSTSIAFASMLEWEDDGLIRDLVPILSPEQLTQDDIFAPFKDGVASNQDVRIAYDPSGNEVLLYSLTSQGVLVIASDTETFKEVVARLNTPPPITR